MSKAHPFKRDVLQADMVAARAQTLQLFADVDDTTFCQQIHPNFSPVGWHLAHIAFTEALWILEHCAGQAVLASNYRRLFAADGLPKVERQNLPSRDWILNYLETVRSRVFDYLNIAPLAEQARLWYWLLQHESQHNETISFLLHLHQGQFLVLDPPTWADSERVGPDHGLVTIPASYFVIGSDRLEAQDNERPAREVWVDTFGLDRYPVTCAQYQAFMDEGGYEKPDYWSPEGWAWRSQQHITHPLYWHQPEHRPHHPVYGVSHYEAMAYAQWAGKRLPTEVEWEKAACWKPGCPKTIPYPWGKQRLAAQYCNYSHNVGQTTPVNAYPQGQSPSGCWDMLGNVWEWTASNFRGYDGFAAYPYGGYSAAYFDGQHRVMRGGSWATRQWGLRGSFRNWYHPWVREIFVGFRCAL